MTFALKYRYFVKYIEQIVSKYAKINTYRKEKSMNRSDKVFISIVFILSVALFLSTGKLVETVNADLTQAVVTFKDKEVLRINMNKDEFYTVSGELGDVVVEVKDGKIRVAEEISPLNYCSLQGWVDKTNVPIVCLPNKILIVVEANQAATDEDIIIR